MQPIYQKPTYIKHHANFETATTSPTKGRISPEFVKSCIDQSSPGETDPFKTAITEAFLSQMFRLESDGREFDEGQVVFEDNQQQWVLTRENGQFQYICRVPELLPSQNEQLNPTKIFDECSINQLLGILKTVFLIEDHHLSRFDYDYFTSTDKDLKNFLQNGSLPKGDKEKLWVLNLLHRCVFSMQFGSFSTYFLHAVALRCYSFILQNITRLDISPQDQTWNKSGLSQFVAMHFKGKEIASPGYSPHAYACLIDCDIINLSLQYNHQLTSVIMTDQIDDRTFAQFIAALADSSITALTLNCTKWDMTRFKFLISALLIDCGLEKLSLELANGNARRVKEEINELIPYLKTNISLRELTLTANSNGQVVNIEGLIGYLNSKPCLRVLRLDGFSFADDQVSALVQALATNKHLEELHIVGSSLGQQLPKWARLLVNNPTLKVFHLPGKVKYPDDVSAFTQCLSDNVTLKQLLLDLAMDYGGMMDLYRQNAHRDFVQNTTHLVNTIVKHPCLIRLELGLFWPIKLSDAIRLMEHTTLTSLQLGEVVSDSDLTKLTDDEYGPLFKALEKNRTLISFEVFSLRDKSKITTHVQRNQRLFYEQYHNIMALVRPETTDHIGILEEISHLFTNQLGELYRDSYADESKTWGSMDNPYLSVWRKT